MKHLFTFILLILLLPNTYAFYAKLVPTTTQITPGQVARYELTLHNDQNQEDTYTFTTLSSDWILTADPPFTQIPPKSTFHTTLLFQPRSGAPLGSQRLLLTIQSQQSHESQKEKLLINLLPSTQGGLYEPQINLGLDVPQEQDPRKPLSIYLTLRNQNPLNYSNLRIEVSGELFYKEENIALLPDEVKPIHYTFQLNPKQKPDTHFVIARLNYQNQTIAENKKLYHISTYDSIHEQFSLSKGFLKTEQTFTLQNQGNAPHIYIKTLHYPFYLKMFITSQPTPLSAHGNWQWRHTLLPEETLTITLQQNYRPLLYLAILIVLSTLAYYFFRNPLIAHKEAIPQDQQHWRTEFGRESLSKHEAQDESSQFKVRLLVVNRTGKTFHHLRVIDKIPSMAHLTKNQTGVLPPHKTMTTEKKDTLIIWEIDSLDPYEERLITYHIKSKLRLYGGIHLPPTKIKYETKKGREKKTYSNPVHVFSKRKE
ncbi:MAG: hypothetical protein AABX70_08280 [Nanoarchaeota archaeon]